MRVIASHNPDSGIRRLSSSGGVFSMLAEEVLSKGGRVYGAALNDNMSIVHTGISDPEELYRLRDSKYVYSSLGSAIDDAIEDLDEGKEVLFSGTPCQIAAVSKRAGNHKNLLLVEIVCHGAPESVYWERYLDELLSRKLKTTRNDIETITFRDKSTGWRLYSFTIKFKDGTVFTQPASRNLYMMAFLKDLTLRKACFRCPFKYPEGSKADITIGDFWGIEKIAHEIDNDLGTTIVIARTARGEESISSLPADGTFDLEKAARFNPAITTPATPPAEYERFAKEAASADSIISLFNKYVGITLKRRLNIYMKLLLHPFSKR